MQIVKNTTILFDPKQIKIDKKQVYIKNKW